MSYKTILCYAHSADGAARQMPLTMEMAGRFGAHVVGLHLQPDLGPANAADVGAQADAARAAFEAEVAKGADVSQEWRSVRARQSDVTDELVEHARACDLTVISKADGRRGFRLTTDLMGELILGSGRPVVVVPTTGRHERIGGTVLLAWNGSRESTRAAFDALPILKGAQHVRLFGVRGASTDEEVLPAADIASALSRHGVKVEVDDVGSAAGERIGSVLLNHASDVGADLIVMGGYGRSRLREFVFGGASRDILGTMTVPVLLSH